MIIGRNQTTLNPCCFLQMSPANNSTVSLIEEDPGVQQPWSSFVVYYSYLLYPLVLITATIGNGLVCLVTYRRYKKNTLKNYYVLLFNLAFSDIVFAWVTNLFDLPLNVTYDTWIYPEEMCSILYMIQNTAYYTSIFTLAVISLVRFQGIIYPFKRPLSNKQAVILSVLLWVVSGAVRVPEAYSYRVVDGSCTSTWSNTEKKLAVSLYTLFTFVVPFAITLISYIYIGKHLNGRLVLENQKSNQRVISSNKKVIKMLVIGSSAFAACVIPLHVTIFLLIFEVVTPNKIFWDFFLICNGIASVHCMVNPVCYTLSNSGFRKEVYEAITVCDTSQRRKRAKDSSLSTGISTMCKHTVV